MFIWSQLVGNDKQLQLLVCELDFPGALARHLHDRTSSSLCPLRALRRRYPNAERLSNYSCKYMRLPKRPVDNLLPHFPFILHMLVSRQSTATSRSPTDPTKAGGRPIGLAAATANLGSHRRLRSLLPNIDSGAERCRRSVGFAWVAPLQRP